MVQIMLASGEHVVGSGSGAPPPASALNLHGSVYAPVSHALRV